MLQGVLFDMDGVLFDTERMDIEVAKQDLAGMGYTVPAEFMLRTAGMNDLLQSRLMQEELGPDFDYPRYERLHRESMRQRLDREGMPVMKGAAMLLEYLRQNGYTMAVASSATLASIEHHLEAAGMRHYFTAIAAGDKVAASKPAPDIFAAAAKAIGLPPQQCAAIEDSANGVRSAAGAGCVTIMVPDLIAPDEELRALAAAVLNSLEEVPAFLEWWNANAPEK